MRFEPFAVGVRPFGARAGRADIGDFGAGLDQQAGHQQLAALVAGDGDACLDRVGGQDASDRRQRPRLGGIGREARRGGDRIQPGGRTIESDGTGTHDGAASGAHLPHARRVEGVDGSGDDAVERRIQVTPFAGRQLRRDAQAHRRQQRRDTRRIAREQLADQGHGRQLGQRPRPRHWPGFGFEPGVAQHRAGQHVLRFRVRRHAKARNVDADDADTVDLFRQQLERHARRSRHAEIDDDDGVVVRRFRGVVDRLANVLEQLAGDQRLRVERHVADRTLGTIEMRREGQPIHAAGAAREDRRDAAHPQTHAQRAEGRTHALRLIMRPTRIVGRQLRHGRRLAGRARGFQQSLTPAMATLGHAQAPS